METFFVWTIAHVHCTACKLSSTGSFTIYFYNKGGIIGSFKRQRVEKH